MDFLNQLSKEQRAIADKVVAAARKYGVPENIALGMAMQESGFDQSKASGTGPVGVLQVGKKASKDLKINPKNVDENIDGGMRYFKQQLDRTGNIDAALVAYHDGPSSDFFKGGSMSPAAANHIKKVKGYAGMANDTTTTTPQSSTGDFEIPQAGEIQTIDFDTGAGADAAPYTGPRLRDTNDVAAGAVGAAAGYGIGKSRQVSQKEQALELQAKALALREQNAQYDEARRQQNWEYQRELDAHNETVRQQKAAYQRALEDHEQYLMESKLSAPKQYGTGTENWKDQEYGEVIARQLDDPLSKGTASADANAAIGLHQRASKMFPVQVPASEGSLLSIPIVTGGSTPPPFTQRKTKPTPETVMLPPRQPEPPPMPPRPAPVQRPEPRVEPKPANRLQTAGNSLLGGLAGLQLYKAYQDIKEGKVLDGLTSGTGGLSALLGTAVKSPRMKALSAVPASMSFVPELMDYFNSSEEAPAKAEGGMIESVPHYGVGGAVKDAAKKGVQMMLSELADRFPVVIPGVMKKDKTSGKEYLGKALSDEETALQKARKAAQKDIDKGNYQPFFDVSQRAHVDPANYPMKGATITDALPKQAATKDKWAQQFDTPEAAARLRAAYGKAKDDPLAHDWYAMGQLEQEFIKELGPDKGREMFRKRFAEPMAATTGGADPTANMLSAYYGNFMNQAGMPMGSASHQLPHPIGGRYIMGNLDQYNKIINQGAGLTTATPKRFNFASDFMGHQNRPTLDEQMSRIFDPKLAAPPGDSYGVMEGVLNKAAAAEGVSPVNFQEVAWAGQKGTKGKPMIQHVNEAIERTSRVTGKSPEEVLRDSFIHARSPLYGGAAAGLGGLSQYEDQR